MTMLEELKTLHAYNSGDKETIDSIDEALVNQLCAKLSDEHLPRIIEALEWGEEEQGRLRKALEKDPHSLFSTEQTALSVVIQQLKTKLEGEK